MLNSRVKLEAPHQKRELPQCGEGQDYGHIKILHQDVLHSKELGNF